ncbi:RidA family protein [uncultured Anaeromusa sp.]|uniref:RidA family protein n=1 Tax=uncultured Anaeromusa sp. TaxID=673273 RepID=UPI0029C80542|nr:RidA family protein [uncultured Anaeromusa sp.]
MKEIINTKKAPGAIGPYSQAVKANGFVFISGQLPLNPETGEFPEGGVKEQTRQSLKNLQAILEADNLSFSDVVRTGVFLKNMEDFAAMNEVYGEFFTEKFPARVCVEVARLPKDARVEIEVTAVCE